jgi:hypothetical protein
VLVTEPPRIRHVFLLPLHRLRPPNLSPFDPAFRPLPVHLPHGRTSPGETADPGDRRATTGEDLGHGGPPDWPDPAPRQPFSSRPNCLTSTLGTPQPRH